MAWAMAAAANASKGLARQSQTGYQDSSTNNAVGSAIPQRLQDFMGVPMQRLNDKIMSDRQNLARRQAAQAATQAGVAQPMQNASDAISGKQCNCG